MISPQVARLVALIAAGATVVTSAAAVAAMAITGHIDSNSAPIIVAVFTLDTSAVPALIAVATTKATQVQLNEVHSLVNGNYSAAIRVLASVAAQNPDRRASDAAAAAAHALLSALPPPPGAAPQ